MSIHDTSFDSIHIDIPICYRLLKDELLNNFINIQFKYCYCSNKWEKTLNADMFQ